MSGRPIPYPQRMPRSWRRATAAVLALASFLVAAGASRAAAPRAGWLGACGGPRASGSLAPAGPLPDGFWAALLRSRGTTPAKGSRTEGGAPGEEEPSRRLAGVFIPATLGPDPGAEDLAAAWAGR